TLLSKTTPPTSQKTIEESLIGEKQPNVPNINIQTSILALQEAISKMQEMMIKNHKETRADISELKDEMGKLKAEMKADISKVEGKIGSLQQAMERNEVKIKDIESRTTRMETNFERMDEEFKNVLRETEDSLVHLEMDKAMAYLRFQNVAEAKNEELEHLMAEILAEWLGKEKDDLIKQFDEVYRVSTSYARRNNCPREIHIRFSRRCLRDLILKMSREETISYKGREIRILKQIPKRVRMIRQDYKFLANDLNKEGIHFKWLIPEGMLITWKERKIKIESIEQAQVFHQQLTDKNSQPTKEEPKTRPQEVRYYHRTQNE
uniref:L1 transposable element RRM domain-containing protein n=1 Tax=Pseudonaja textilis TaxID=8673 RepID=A0A670Y2Q6_PSETE